MFNRCFDLDHYEILKTTRCLIDGDFLLICFIVGIAKGIYSNSSAANGIRGFTLLLVTQIKTQEYQFHLHTY